MIEKISRNKQQLERGLLVVVLIVAVLLVFNSNSISNRPVIIPKTGSINALSGNLTGDAYLSSDSSAFSNNKVTFGNPNSVSFYNPGSSAPSTTITTGNLANSSKISRLDYGANIAWYDGGYGAQNPSTNQFYPDIVNLTKSIGISALRYPGGIPSDTFNWQNAVGPQNSRTDDVVYQEQDTFLPTTFGPDEFGQFLQQTDSAGDITANFGTGTAQEAADWVQYMTASSKTNYWGQLRAKNGHPAPYDIPYWEVGNEQQSSSGENYWRSGEEVSIGTGNGECHIIDIHLCEYVYGGVTSFSKQPALGADNSTTGNGLANQIFYAKYPPVEINSQSIYINGKLWHQVGSLTNASSTELAYELNNNTGQMTFGDGIHGAVVPIGATVLISYHSGPHDGFLQFYKLMKAADPQAKICSAYDSDSFIKLMGSSNPYDCLVIHLYGGEVPSDNSSASLFHNSLMEQSYDFKSYIDDDNAAIKQYAGARAKNISLAVTEYGVNAQTYPSGQPNYHRSQDMALFTANTLRVLINAHVPLAERHFLVSYQNSSAPGPQVYINSNNFSNNALIAGPGPNAFLQPSAYILQAYSKLLYSNLVSSQVQKNPTVVYSSGNYPALATVATTDNKGREAIMVINMSAATSISATVRPSTNDFNDVNAWTLGSNSFLTYNTLSDPSAVNFVETNSHLSNGKLTASFPPSSVTVLQLSK